MSILYYVNSLGRKFTARIVSRSGWMRGQGVYTKTQADGHCKINRLTKEIPVNIKKIQNM